MFQKFSQRYWIINKAGSGGRWKGKEKEKGNDLIFSEELRQFFEPFRERFDWKILRRWTSDEFNWRFFEVLLSSYFFLLWGTCEIFQKGFLLWESFKTSFANGNEGRYFRCLKQFRMFSQWIGKWRRLQIKFINFSSRKLFYGH